MQTLAFGACLAGRLRDRLRVQLELQQAGCLASLRGRIKLRAEYLNVAVQRLVNDYLLRRVPSGQENQAYESVGQFAHSRTPGEVHQGLESIS